MSLGTPRLPQHQTFRARLPEVIDQAQHFASIQSAGSSRGGDAAIAAFREGMDGTERERSLPGSLAREEILLTAVFCAPAVFQLAQDSARRTKAWYDTNERSRR